MAKKKKRDIGICELCEREEVEITVHHLTPKEMGEPFYQRQVFVFHAISRYMLFTRMKNLPHV